MESGFQMMDTASKQRAATMAPPRKSIQERQKFRYLNGEIADPFNKFENVTPGINNDQDGMACNGKLTAVNWSFAASIAVFSTYDYKRFDQNIPLLKGHQGPITDLQWCPFQDKLLASSSDDSSIKLWIIENEKGLTEHTTEFAMSFDDHIKKCKALQWHPIVENMLASYAEDNTVRIWDCN